MKIKPIYKNLLNLFLARYWTTASKLHRRVGSIKILLLSALLLTGCTGTGFGGQRGQPFAGLESLNATNGQIYVYRPYKKFWLKAYPNISVDAEIAGELRNGTYVVIELPPRKYNLAILQNEYWAIPDMTTEIEVKAGERLFYRVAAIWEDMSVDVYGPIGLVSFSTKARFELVAEEVAVREINDLLKYSDEGAYPHGSTAYDAHTAILK